MKKKTSPGFNRSDLMLSNNDNDSINTKTNKINRTGSRKTTSTNRTGKLRV